MWLMASCNVRTTLDVGGLIETARQWGDSDVVDERKVDQVVAELDKYSGCGWFTRYGSDVYKVAESIVWTISASWMGSKPER